MNHFFRMQDVSKTFGGLDAVRNFSLTAERGELLGLIGPNGAGKTTLFNLITGLQRPTSGDIILNGESIVKRAAHQITALGIARTFQNLKLFEDMTVLENIMVSFHYASKAGFLSALLGLPESRKEEKRIRKQSLLFLQEVGLAHQESEKAQNLAYGQQRKLEIARALATGPKLLLLDEPAAGMNPMEKSELARLIRQIRDKYGITILLIEHDMKFVMNLCERITVVEYGYAIAEGTPAQIRTNPEVIRAYLGAFRHASS